MGKREILAYSRGWTYEDDYRQLHNPSRIDWLVIWPVRYVYRWWAYFRRYGFKKGLIILSLQPLIRQVAKEIKATEELEELKSKGRGLR